MAAAIALATLATLHARALDYRGDDAFITLRYVQNLIAGHGLVYNPGERVEGYSNLLWLLALAGPARLGVDMVGLARASGMLLAGVNVFLTYLLARRLEATPLRSLLAPLLVAVATPLATWAGSGLETPLFSALILAALLARFRERPSFAAVGAWLGLVALARPEGLLFALSLAAYELTGFASRSPRPATCAPAGMAAAGRLLAGAGALWLPQLAFRRWYYAEWLPNTYFAKVDQGAPVLERGLAYLRDYCTFASWLPFACLLVGVLSGWRDGRVRCVAVLLGAYLAWIVSVGGDGLAMFRFIAQVLPLMCLLIARGVGSSLDALRQAARACWPSHGLGRFAIHTYATTPAALLALALCWPSALMLLRPQWPWWKDVNGVPFPDPSGRWLYFDQYFSERVARAGRFLSEHAGRNELIAANPAGIAFHTRQPVLDLLGLTDATIARSRSADAGHRRAGHARSNAAYVLRRKPAYVLLGNVAVGPFPLDEEQLRKRLYLQSEQALWQIPAFRRDYQRVSVELAPSGPFRSFTFYRRHDAQYRGSP